MLFLISLSSVPESLWKPHQSKDMLFLVRNCIQKKINSKKNYFFWLKKSKKYFQKKWKFLRFFFQYNFHLKWSNFQKNSGNFHLFSKIFFHFFLIDFFLSWKKIGYSFDAEKSYLSIGGVFRVIPALLHARKSYLPIDNFCTNAGTVNETAL